MLESLYLHSAEWPWLCIMSLAVYLSFEHWRLPDLTVEGAFTAGIVTVYVITRHASGVPASILLFLLLWLALPILLSVTTSLLILMRLPVLFAGLLVMLSSYSLNYHLNGSDMSQTLDLRDSIPAVLRISNVTTAQHYFMFAALIAMGLALIVPLIQSSQLGLRLYLARRTPNQSVVRALGLRLHLNVVLAMLIYNSIAFLGGTAFALQNSYSGVSFLAALTPGLACVFIVRGVKQLAAAPRTRSRRIELGKLVDLLIRSSESTTFVITIIALVSLAVTLIRFELRAFATPGMLNAYIALGTMVIWWSFAVIASILGKPILGFDHDDL